MVVDCLAQRWRAKWKLASRFQARLASRRSEEGRTLMCQPLTFMNESGQAVGALSRYYQVSPDKILVLLDDADLPLGELRMRPKGGSGGHHGVESVIQHLATDRFPRLRLGIGRPIAGERLITNHVLDRFGIEEWKIAEQMVARAADQVECWMRAGMARAMNDFNGMVQLSEQRNSE
jgi:PTH1 family peptidyl-tRNA hydrolase